MSSKVERFDFFAYLDDGVAQLDYRQSHDGSYVRYEDYDRAMARVDELKQEIERLASKTAVTMGVGNGAGQLFVHGDYDSIKAAQEIILERDKLTVLLRKVLATHDYHTDDGEQAADEAHAALAEMK